MKNSILVALAALLAFSCGSPEAFWTEGPREDDGRAVNTLILKNVPAGSRVWFQELFDNKEILEGPEIYHFQGTSRYIDVPVHAGKEVVIKYRGRALPRHSWAPEGFVLQVKGKEDRAFPVTCTFLERESTEVAEKWFACGYNVQPTDIIPEIKRVNCKAPAFSGDARPAGWYRISFDGEGKAQTEAAGEEGAFYARTTLEKLPEGIKDCVIEDWPDMFYRGLMLDVVRDFRTKAEVLAIIDLMASYKLNRLHFHLGDDEAWCLEIPAIPELTEFSGRHALPDWDFAETRALKPTANGRIGNTTFYTKDEFVEILKYARERQIAVIPEFDTPGHSRSSIKAMQSYERKTGDASFRLQDPSDESRYWSAQDFKDNVLSVELPGVYKFYRTVFDEVIKMYGEADAPLLAIHIGGDEVPDGAWEGRDRKAVKNAFTEKMLDIAEETGVKLAGWQELALDLEPATLERLKKNLYFVNAWSTHEGVELTYQLANEGIPVLLSNVNNTYVDLAYGDDPCDIGLNWGGYVDERKSFALQPWKIYESCRWTGVDTGIDVYSAAKGKTPLFRPDMIIGVQANLWSENLRSFEDATYQLLPKALGVFERGWNSSPDWPTDEAFFADFDKFYSIISAREKPLWKAAGYKYRER